MFKLWNHIGRRRIVRDGEVAHGTVLDPGFRTDGLGTIELPVPVLSVKGREELWPIRSREPKVDPACVDGHKTTLLKVPYIESFGILTNHSVLPNILFRANAVLATLSEYQAGRLTAKHLQTSVSRYQDSLVMELAGKYGLVNRSVLGARCPNSMRSVILPDPTLRHDEIGIPGDAMRVCAMSPGDPVVAIRSPILWEGSVLILRAVMRSGAALAINPFVMDLLGADFDGDTMAVMKVPPEARKEAVAVGSATVVNFSKWSSEFLMCKSDRDVDWTDPKADLMGRTGNNELYSLSPSDLLDPASSEVLRQMNETGCKKTPSDVVAYAKGLSEKEFCSAAMEILRLTVRMKVELGLVGSITDMVVQAIYIMDRKALRSALQFKEKATQTLLDSKHGDDPFDTMVLSDMFRRRNGWDTKTVSDAVSKLKSFGLDADLAIKVVTPLWGYGVGVDVLLSERSPWFMSTKSGSRSYVLALARDEEDTSIAGHVLNITGWRSYEDTGAAHGTVPEVSATGGI